MERPVCLIRRCPENRDSARREADAVLAAQLFGYVAEGFCQGAGSRRIQRGRPFRINIVARHVPVQAIRNSSILEA